MKISKQILAKVILLDLLFIGLFYYIARFFITRFRGTLAAIQNLSYEFSDVESNLIVNKSNFNPAILQGNLDILNSYFGKLFGYIGLWVLISFLLFVVIKSLGWNLICNNRLKNYKSYLLKFLGLVIIAFALALPISFLLLRPAREFLLEYMFGGTFLWGSFLYVGFYFLLLTFISYLLFTGYVYINKLSFLKSFKEIFSFKKFWLYPIFLGVLLVNFLIIRVSNMINAVQVAIIIQVIAIVLVFVWYKVFLVKKLII